MSFQETDRDRPKLSIGFGTGITTMQQLREAEEREHRTYDWRTPDFNPDARRSRVLDDPFKEKNQPDKDGFMTIAGLRVNPKKIFERLAELKEKELVKQHRDINLPEKEDPPIPQRKPEIFEKIENPPVPERKPELLQDINTELLDFISKFESNGNYNIIVGGEEKPLTEMTIKEVREFQKQRNQKNKGTAVGRYQIIDDKMKDLIRWMKVDENVLFDEEMQDKMGKELLRRRGLQKFKNGQITTEEFIKNLSKEWAALPKDSSNESYYKGVGNNKAHADYKTLKKLLEK